MKKKTSRLFLLFTIGLLVLSACSSSGGKKFTVTFKNYDGTVTLDVQKCGKGRSVTYGGETPTKPSTIPYSYTFADSWLTEMGGSTIDTLDNVIADRTVYPSFSHTTNKECQFGSYPQSKVTDTSIVTSLNASVSSLPTAADNQGWTDYNYYINGAKASFMWYKDVALEGVNYRGVYFTSYRPNHILEASSESGSEQDNYGYALSTTYWFKFEPITWHIYHIDDENSKIFAMSKLVLDAQQYYSSGDNRADGSATIYPNNYQNSDIRSWLNNSFLNQAFTSSQQASIPVTTVNNSADSTGNPNNPYASGNTDDKIFMPSYQDVNNEEYGFSSSSSSRLFTTSDYAEVQGIMKAANGNSNLWTRSSMYNDSTATRYINSQGSLYQQDVRATCIGVLPALWINF